MAPEIDYMTARELESLYLPDQRSELVRGVLRVREPAGYRHGDVAGRMLIMLGSYVKTNTLGVVVAAETGFKLFGEPDTVRAADVAFIRHSRVPTPPPRGFAAMAPDLAIEVLSPDDRARDVTEKTADWLRAGTEQVWLLDPERRCANVYRSDGSSAHYSATDHVSGESVVPGFTLDLRELFNG